MLTAREYIRDEEEEEKKEASTQTLQESNEFEIEKQEAWTYPSPKRTNYVISRLNNLGKIIEEKNIKIVFFFLQVFLFQKRKCCPCLFSQLAFSMLELPLFAMFHKCVTLDVVINLVFVSFNIIS